MPISATEISNILQAQIGMFSTSSQYAQAMSAQYGFQSLGGMGVHDPRATTHPANQSILAGNISGGAIRGAGYGLGGAALMSAFNFGPRAMDPFSQVFSSASRGYKLGGMGGAIGMGMLPAAGYMAAGSAFNWASNQMLSGAQGRSVLNNQIGSMFPRMGIGQVGSTSGMVEGMNRQGMGGLNELTALMGQGKAAGTFQTGNINEFQTSFRKLVTNVKQIANVLNSSINEAHQALVQVKGLGVSSDRAAGFITAMKGMGQAGGLSPTQMFAAAGQGSQIAQQAGISREVGAMGAMRTAGLFSMIESKKLIEGISAESQGRFTGAAFRFLGSRRGRSVLGAIMTPGGEYDPDTASQIASGALSPQEIRKLSSQNLRGRGSRDAFRVRRQELAAQFVSEHGPQGIMSTVGAMADASGRPQGMRSRLTGLNRRDFTALEQLSGGSNSLNQRLTQEALSSFRDGQRQLGLGESMGMVADKFIGPLKEKFKEMGANLTQAVAGALDTAANEFIRRPPPRADPRAYTDAVRKALLGGGGMGGMGMGGSSGMMPSQAGGVAGLIRGAVPTGLRLMGGGTQPGTSLSELPAGGLGTEEWNPYTTGMVGSMIPFSPRGTNILGGTGQALGRMGKGITTTFNVPGSGFMGLGGIGGISGAGRMGGGLMRLGGAALRGLGRVAGPLAPIALGLDYLTNIRPGMQRAQGLAGIDRGAVTGMNASFLRYLQKENVLGEGAFTRKDVGFGGLDFGAAEAQGLTPIGGSFRPGGGGSPGSQGFITTEGREKLEEFMTSSGDISPLREKYGQSTLDKAMKIVNSADMKDIGETDRALSGLIKDPKDRAALIARSPRFTQQKIEGMRKQAEFSIETGAKLLTGSGFGGDSRDELMAQLLDGRTGPLIRASIRRAKNRVGSGFADMSSGDKLSLIKGAWMEAYTPSERRVLRSGIDQGFGAITDSDVAVEGFGELNIGAQRLGQADVAEGMLGARVLFEEERPAARSRAEEVGSQMGISGLGDITDMFGRGGDADLGRGAAIEKFQGLISGMSGRDRGRLGGLLGEANTEAGNVLGNFALRSGRLRTGIGKSKDPSRIYTAMTGRTAVFDRESRRFLSGKGQTWNNKLDSFLTAGARDIIEQQKGIGNASPGELNAMKSVLARGIQAASQGRFDSQEYKAIETQLGSTYQQINPASGKSGHKARTASEFDTHLTDLVNIIIREKGKLKAGEG